jgi:uncharacterized membrane protein
LADSGFSGIRVRKEDIMKTGIIIRLCVFGLIFAFGCGSKYHLIQTKDGKQYVSSHKPEFDKKTQSYEFKDVDGKKWILNREEIQSVSDNQKGTKANNGGSGQT